MRSELVISGAAFTGFAKMLPAIPGLQVLGYFGTGGDGNNGNRIAGGPTFGVRGSAPTYAANYVTVNTGLGTTNAAIDTNLVQTSTVAAGGWTVFLVARGRAGANASTIFSIGQTGPVQFILSDTWAIATPPGPAMTFTGATGGNQAAQTQALPTTAAAWRFLAMTCNGSAAGTYRLDDITDNLSLACPTVFTFSGSPSDHFNLGYSQPSGANYGFLGDIAMAGVATVPMSVGLLQSVRAASLGSLANRGIAGF